MDYMANNFRKGQEDYNQLIRNIREYERRSKNLSQMENNFNKKRMNTRIMLELYFSPRNQLVHAKRIGKLAKNLEELSSKVQREYEAVLGLFRRIEGARILPPGRTLNYYISKLKIIQGRRIARIIKNAALNPNTPLGQRRLSREFMKLQH
jgi:hypothetical protein